jgi:hypothetical protein
MPDMETLGARLAYENGTLKRNRRRWYTRARAMEEAIRKHSEGRCDCESERACLMALYRFTPARPRPTARQLGI